MQCLIKKAQSRRELLPALGCSLLTQLLIRRHNARSCGVMRTIALGALRVGVTHRVTLLNVQPADTFEDTNKPSSQIAVNCVWSDAAQPRLALRSTQQSQQSFKVSGARVAARSSNDAELWAENAGSRLQVGLDT